jgi:two-component system response regulator GlrR
MSNGSHEQTLTLVHQSSQDWAKFRKIKVLVEGSSTGVELGLEPLDIGSSPECDLVCALPQVSRRHCQLSLGEMGVLLEDLGSKNGTFVNGVRVVKAWVTPGEVITLGQARLELSPAKETSQVPLYPKAEFGELKGASIPMRRLFAELERAAKAGGTILIWGETGTGKELIAQAVHDQSSRAEEPFVVLDCGAITESLLEAELFGHDRGAFSGADVDRKGLVEEAEGGTLFLDEIGELSLQAQTALLRLLEQKTYRRVGANLERQANVRIIAATHRDLKARVASKQFREDLYYRLAVLEVTVPPLRQRLDDLPLLVERFLSEKTPPRTLGDLPAGVLDMFRQHSWPGNVRELKNVVERLVAYPDVAPETLLGARGSPPVGGRPSFQHLRLRMARDAAVEDFEKHYFREKLNAHKGNVAAAAADMGVSRQFLYRMLAKYDLRPNDG